MAMPPTPALTRAEVLSLPAVVDLRTARRALGLSRAAAYRQAHDGTLPGLLPSDGRRIRVAVAPLLDVLGLSWPHTGDTDEINRGGDSAGTGTDQHGSRGADRAHGGLSIRSTAGTTA